MRSQTHISQHHPLSKCHNIIIMQYWSRRGGSIWIPIRMDATVLWLAPLLSRLALAVNTILSVFSRPYTATRWWNLPLKRPLIGSRIPGPCECLPGCTMYLQAGNDNASSRLYRFPWCLQIYIHNPVSCDYIDWWWLLCCIEIGHFLPNSWEPLQACSTGMVVLLCVARCMWSCFA